MTDMDQTAVVQQPEPYATALIRLLQGFLYADDGEAWDLLLRYRSSVESYFARMGLELYINEVDGFAYLSQPDAEDDAGAAVSLPRLTRRRPLTYSVTILLVLLRDELNQFDRTNLEANRLIIPREHLVEQMRSFYAQRGDERQLLAQIQKDINQVIDLGFLKEITHGEQVSYLVRPVLKAKINSDQLAQIKAQLEQHAHDDSTDN